VGTIGQIGKEAKKNVNSLKGRWYNRRRSLAGIWACRVCRGVFLQGVWPGISKPTK